QGRRRRIAHRRSQRKSTRMLRLRVQAIGSSFDSPCSRPRSQTRLSPMRIARANVARSSLSRIETKPMPKLDLTLSQYRRGRERGTYLGYCRIVLKANSTEALSCGSMRDHLSACQHRLLREGKPDSDVRIKCNE